MRSRSTVFGLFLVALVLIAPAVGVAAPTAGKQIRVKVSLHVTGNYQHSGPKTIPNGAMFLPIRISVDNNYSSEYVVPVETILTGLQKTNPLDPASAREMDDYSARVKAHNDRVYHSADNLRGRGPGAPADMRAAMNPMAMMNGDMMQKIMACGQDQACKQKVAMEMMSRQQAQVSGPGAQVQAEVQKISNMCISEKHQKMGSKGYEDCMNAEGNKRSTVKRSAADDEHEVAELPDRYFLYRAGVNDCQFKARGSINESGTWGSISDGEGGGGYFEGSSVVNGEGSSDPKAFQPCSNVQAAFDTETSLFWGGLLFKPDIALNGNGAAGHGSQEKSREINEWIASTLKGAPASGTRTQKFGYQMATLTWSYVRE
jgi:hypothetical protein